MTVFYLMIKSPMYYACEVTARETLIVATEKFKRMIRCRTGPGLASTYESRYR